MEPDWVIDNYWSLSIHTTNSHFSTHPYKLQLDASSFMRENFFFVFLWYCRIPCEPWALSSKLLIDAFLRFLEFLTGLSKLKWLLKNKLSFINSFVFEEIFYLIFYYNKVSTFSSKYRKDRNSIFPLVGALNWKLFHAYSER